MSIVTDFKSIRRKLERQEQKAKFEEENPTLEQARAIWHGTAVPLVPVVFDWAKIKI